ncbi:MAG: hypothetical protein CXR31_10090 [Geobacter sp.]|nr:MAG: hypothetical protein CXR31_10090 [Geobacter sp.]
MGIRELSANQFRFVVDALASGFDVDFTFSGRHMTGRCCPASYVNNFNDLITDAVVCRENSELGLVVYAMY